MEIKMKWAVEIQKTNLERRNLGDLLSGLGITLVNGIEFPAFTSPEIDMVGTAEEAFEKAKHLRDAINGPAQTDPSFTLGSVIDYSCKPPKRHAFLEVHSTMQNQIVGNVTLTVSPPKGLSDDELAWWKAEHAELDYQAKLEAQRSKLEPAFRSQVATKVLELLSINNPSAETIYKIYELLEGNSDNRNQFHAQYGISANQFDRFRDAVHNPNVTGDWARHAVGDTPRTNNPMSKDEAEQFIRNIASQWLAYVRSSGTS